LKAEYGSPRSRAKDPIKAAFRVSKRAKRILENKNINASACIPQERESSDGASGSPVSFINVYPSGRKALGLHIAPKARSYGIITQYISLGIGKGVPHINGNPRIVL
jgi:hypothetical protein